MKYEQGVIASALRGCKDENVSPDCIGDTFVSHLSSSKCVFRSSLESFGNIHHMGSLVDLPLSEMRVSSFKTVLKLTLALVPVRRKYMMGISGITYSLKEAYETTFATNVIRRIVSCTAYARYTFVCPTLFVLRHGDNQFPAVTVVV